MRITDRNATTYLRDSCLRLFTVYCIDRIALLGTKVWKYVLLFKIDGVNSPPFSSRHASLYFYVVRPRSLAASLDQAKDLNTIEDASCHPIMLLVCQFFFRRTRTYHPSHQICLEAQNNGDKKKPSAKVPCHYTQIGDPE